MLVEAMDIIGGGSDFALNWSEIEGITMGQMQYICSCTAKGCESNLF